ncbi:hypothetical protein BZG78_15010 [Salinivibrio sp. MA351]|uniref:hypothetical protein n=1 Tax=Salinivibrio sp. MA351 TaxID=1909453 RepID=UPI000988B04E|nr:hypothetical protein [Salinivibrio sp. MA351]OOE95416.1 hypothetical protein BZG78_15010 [Salinivibrio sp. MA351]
MISNETVERLEEQLYTDRVEYNWEQVGPDGNYSPMVRWALSLMIGLFLPTFLMIVSDASWWSTAFWFCFTLAVMGVLITRYLFIPDKHRCYYLTSMGIHYTEKDMIPDVAYQVVRGFAWVGIVVCVIAVFVLGPLAFVGAGGFALMSFGMTNFKPTTEKHEVFFSDRPILFNPMSDSILRIDSNIPTEYSSSRNFYFSSLGEKDAVVSLIKKIRKDIEYVEMTKMNDMFKHPIFIQD